MDLKTLLTERLTEALSPTLFNLIDESHLHIGHEGAKNGGKHFAVEIESPAFKDLSSVGKQKLIYKAIGDLIPLPLHAIRIIRLS